MYDVISIFLLIFVPVSSLYKLKSSVGLLLITWESIVLKEGTVNWNRSEIREIVRIGARI